MRRTLWLLVAGGCALRLTGLTSQSLWFDECATVHVATADDPFATLREDRHPPLSFLAFRLWIACFGEHDPALRLLPALLGCVTVLLFADAARRLLTPAGATLATALLAAAPMSVWYAQEVRMYAFVELGAVLAAHGLARLHHGQARRGTAAIALGSATALGSHYLGGTVAAQIVVAALLLPLPRRARGLAIGAALLGVLVWAPWVVMVIPEQLRTSWGFQARMSWLDVLQLPVRWLLVHLGELPRALVWFAAGGTYLGLSLAAWAARRDASARAWLALAATPAVCAGALALFLPPNFAPNYLIAAAPWCLGAVALGLARLPASLRRAAWALPATAAVATLLLRGQTIKEDYRTACAELEQALQPGDRIVSVTGTVEAFSQAPLRHHLRHLPDLEQRLVTPERAAELLGEPTFAARVHVIWRAADYALPTLDMLRDRAAVLHRGETRRRIQHLVLAPR